MAKIKKDKTKEPIVPDVLIESSKVKIQTNYYQTVARLGEIQILINDLENEAVQLTARVAQLREEFKTQQ